MKRDWLDEWYETPCGRHLWRRERGLLAPLLSECFGHHGLEVGTPSGAPGLLEDCSLGHRMRLHLAGDGGVHGSFRGRLDMLAIRPRSLVVVVLVHVLEYLPAPAAALAAVEQALAPGGRLVALCFDPVSMAALRHRLVPRQLRWWPDGAGTPRRCGERLRGLQLDLERQYRAWRLPLSASEDWQHRLDWLDGLGPAWPLGAVYAMSARKRERQGSAIHLGRKLPRRMLAPGMPRPTSSSVIEDSAA